MPASGATDSLGLVVSADCNLRCAYCYQDRKQPRQMSWRDDVAGARPADQFEVGGELMSRSWAASRCWATG